MSASVKPTGGTSGHERPFHCVILILSQLNPVLCTAWFGYGFVMKIGPGVPFRDTENSQTETGMELAE